MDVISNFLKEHDFNLVVQDSSNNFGDSFRIFEDSNIALRVSCVHSLNSIDACSLNEKDNWFDLALLKAFLNNEMILSKPMSADDYISFVKEEIETIKNLFDIVNYPTTKSALQKLEKERIKQMFPNITRL